MSTRCNIEFYTQYDEKNKPQKGVILYHHYDGYPRFMGNRLPKMLDRTFELLKGAGYPYWWDDERVTATLIKLDGQDYEEKEEGRGGIPVFQPCSSLHGDIEYLWRVYLGPKDGKYKIKCYDVTMDWDKNEIKSLKEIKNWKALAKKGH